MDKAKRIECIRDVATRNYYKWAQSGFLAGFFNISAPTTAVRGIALPSEKVRAVAMRKLLTSDSRSSDVGSMLDNIEAILHKIREQEHLLLSRHFRLKMLGMTVLLTMILGVAFLSVAFAPDESYTSLAKAFSLVAGSGVAYFISKWMFTKKYEKLVSSIEDISQVNDVKDWSTLS